MFRLPLVDLFHDGIEAGVAFDGVVTPLNLPALPGRAGLSHSLAWQNTPKRLLHRFPSQGPQVPPPVGKPEWRFASRVEGFRGWQASSAGLSGGWSHRCVGGSAATQAGSGCFRSAPAPGSAPAPRRQPPPSRSGSAPWPGAAARTAARRPPAPCRATRPARRPTPALWLSPLAPSRYPSLERGEGGGVIGRLGGNSPRVGGSKGPEPLASPNVLHWVGWLPGTTRCGAGPAAPPRTARRRAARSPSHGECRLRLSTCPATGIAPRSAPSSSGKRDPMAGHDPGRRGALTTSSTAPKLWKQQQWYDSGSAESRPWFGTSD